jgi:hypothetical protein
LVIIEGPDSTGKTTLARLISGGLSMPYYHFTKESTYMDYLRLLCSLDSLSAVVDRWVFSEYPYSVCMGRKFAFSLKEWHNLILLTLAQNPIIIFCTHQPKPQDYSDTQYLPYAQWAKCLQLYESFFDSEHIGRIEYDYDIGVPINGLHVLHTKHMERVAWWIPMWKAGYSCTGSPNPEYLLVAERIGPNNVNNLPFETGPTGLMLSNMLKQSETPLGKFAVTNMVKSYRRDPRPPNDNDILLLGSELLHLKPRVAVFMGSVAKRYGTKVAKDLGIEVVGMTHFGYFSHRGISDITPLINQWKNIIGNSPLKEEKIGEKGNRPAVSFTTTSL